MHLVVQQRDGEQPPQVVDLAAGPRSGVGERHGDVAVPGPQRGQRLRRLALGERHLQPRVPVAQVGQGAGDDRRGRRRERHHPDPACPQAGQGGDLLLRGVDREKVEKGLGDLLKRIR